MTAIGTLLWSTTAFAQATPQQKDEEIIVTGSRVIKNGNDSPSPTTIVSSQELLTAQPGQLSDALQILPVFAGSRGSGSNPSSTGSSTGGNGAANVISLRGLGGQRTLPLLDGQRIPPSMFNGNVDVDIIPQMLVQRVDIVTGGVSAVYGSDAVSGVVNYIMDKHFNGIKFQASQGLSSQGDGEKTDIGVAFGRSFADGRGHFEASYEFRNEAGLLYHTDRSWLAQAGVTGLGTSVNPFSLIQNTRLSNTAFGGLITNGVLAGQVFKSNGVLSPFVHGQATGVGTIEVGGDGGYYNGSLLSPMQSHQYFARFDFDVTDNIKFYAEALGNFKQNRSYADYMTLSNVTISATNPFLAPQYQAALAAAKQGTFNLSEIVADGPRESPTENTDQQIFKAGISGKLGRYEWGIDGIYGVTKLHTTLANNVNYQHLAASLDAVTNASGQIVCRTAATTNPGCVPINVFGPTAANAAALAYIMQNTDWHGETQMPDIVGHISGAPVSLPAGPLNVALSGEWRETIFQATTTSSAYAPVNCTGIAYNCSTTTKLTDLSLSAFPRTSESVWELAGEFDAPVFGTEKGRGLNINGAARYTNYEYSGKYVTWKGGADFRLTDTLRFRATASRDIRAPNIFDLFAPANPTINTTLDLLTGLSTTLQTGGGGGNPALIAEKSNTYTAGIVWKPNRKFSISVDYFHITINDAIAQVSGRDAASQAQCYASGGSSPYCALQQRANGSVAAAIAAYNANPASVIGNPAYVATNYQSQNLNVAQQVTYGWDLEVNYGTHVMNRPLTFRVLAAYQPHLYTYQPGLATTDYAGVGWGPNGFSAVPKVSVTALANFRLSPAITFDAMEKWQSSLKISGVPTDVFAPGQGSVSSWATTNVTVTWAKDIPWGKAETYLNIQNLFNVHPPVGAFTTNVTRAGERDGFPVGDSPMGMYFTLGLRVKA